jgi:hypothetical protein
MKALPDTPAENIPMISNKTLFDHYGIRRIW